MASRGEPQRAKPGDVMAEPVQLEKVVQRLIEHYTRSVKEALAGEEAGASAAEARVNVALQRLNQQLER